MHRPRQFVSEQRRRGKHFGVVAAAIDLKIGPARECGAHANDNFPRSRLRDRLVLDTHIFPAIEHRGCHFVSHYFYFLRLATLLMVSGLRFDLWTLVSSSGGAWFDNDFHGTGAWIRGYSNRLNRIFKRKTVRNKARKVKTASVSLENNPSALVLNFNRSAV